MKRKIILLVLPMLILSGCINNGTDDITPTLTPVVIEPTPIGTAPIPIQIYNIGESVNDANTRMTLNSVRFEMSIDENGEIETIPETGNQFIIVNITIENIGHDKNLSYSGEQFKVLESNGQYIYDEDGQASSSLANSFNGDNIRNVSTGEMAFQIPDNATELTLRFEYFSSSGTPNWEIFKLR